MKKIITMIAALGMAAAMNAQTLMTEGFEQGSIPSTWTTVDADGDGYGWTITVDHACEGTFSATSETWNRVGGALTPDNWLVSPALSVPDSGYVANWSSAAVDARYPGDKYSVYIASSNSVEAFLAAGPQYTEVVASADCGGRSLNLDAYAGQTIYIAFRHYDCADVLAMKIDGIRVFAPTSADISADRVQHPFMATTGQSVRIGCELTNHSDQVISSVGFRYVVNGTDTSAWATVSGIGISPEESAIVYHTMPYVAQTPGVCNIEVMLSAPNGVADNDTDNRAEGSFLVPDESYAVERTLVIEQFTGASCGACPSGHDRMAQALGNRTDYVWLMHHTFSTDAFSNEASYALKWFYGVDGEYAPAVMYDRSPIPADYPEPIRNVDDVADIRQQLTTAKNRPSFLTLDMDGLAYDVQSRRISGSVNGRFTQGIYGPDTRIVIYLVEDSLWMYQTDYIHGSSDRTHDDVARGSINGNWGERLEVSSDGTFSYAVDYVLPAGHYAPKSRLAAVVFNYDSHDLNNCAVMNGAETPYLATADLGISQSAGLIALSVYPNPVSNTLSVAAGSPIREIRMTDLVGREVLLQRSIDSESATVRTSHLAAGLYLLTVKTDEGLATQRISVVR